MNSSTLKYLAIAAAGFYVYKLSKEKGAPLQGRVGPFTVSPNTVVDVVMPFVSIQNPIVRTVVSHAAKSFLNGYLGEDNSDAIDCEYRRLS